jgi:hypothetical protein
MDLNSKRLSLADARLEVLLRTDADLHAQLLELADLREQLREAQVSLDLPNATRARRRAPGVIAAVA